MKTNYLNSMKTISSKPVGFLFVLLGVICIFYPVVTSLWINLMVAIGLIVGAVFAIFRIPSGDSAWDKFFSIVLAVIYFAGGLFMFQNPAEGVAAMMFALGIMFLAEGLAMLVYAFKTSGKAKTLILINGLVAAILGILVLSNIGSGLWFIGTLVGIKFIFTGAAVLGSSRKS